MVYNKYTYLYPPRPEHAILPLDLARFEARGYVCQIKKNGTSNVMAISPDRQITAMMRDRKPHKAWEPDERTRRAFLDLPGKGWYYFCAELLHSKVSGLRHTNYIFDILVADGTRLEGTTFSERQTILGDLFPNSVESMGGGYRVIDQHTWLAVTYPGSFYRLFQTIQQRHRPEDEGLVLKKPNAKLAFCVSPTSNEDWQVKCRLPTANYAH